MSNTHTRGGTHTQQWTSHATTWEYDPTKHEVRAVTHMVTQSWGVTTQASVVHTMRTSGLFGVEIVETWPNGERAQSVVPIANYHNLVAESPIEPCLALAHFLPELKRIVQETWDTWLSEYLSTRLTDGHNAHSDKRATHR